MSIIEELNSYGYYILKHSGYIEVSNGVHNYKAVDLELLLKVVRIALSNRR